MEWVRRSESSAQLQAFFSYHHFIFFSSSLYIFALCLGRFLCRPKVFFWKSESGRKKQKMSLTPKICFVCHIQTYNLSGHLQENHTKCPVCSWWHTPPSSDERCARCIRANKSPPTSPASPPTSPASPPASPSFPSIEPNSSNKSMWTGFYTKKCAYHAGQKVSRYQLQNCPQCHIHCINKKR